jgi:hypothetical protein
MLVDGDGRFGKMAGWRRSLTTRRRSPTEEGAKALHDHTREPVVAKKRRYETAAFVLHLSKKLTGTRLIFQQLLA